MKFNWYSNRTTSPYAALPSGSTGVEGWSIWCLLTGMGYGSIKGVVRSAVNVPSCGLVAGGCRPSPAIVGTSDEPTWDCAHHHNKHKHTPETNASPRVNVCNDKLADRQIDRQTDRQTTNSSKIFCFVLSCLAVCFAFKVIVCDLTRNKKEKVKAVMVAAVSVAMVAKGL